MLIDFVSCKWWLSSSYGLPLKIVFIFFKFGVFTLQQRSTCSSTRPRENNCWWSVSMHSTPMTQALLPAAAIMIWLVLRALMGTSLLLPWTDRYALWLFCSFFVLDSMYSFLAQFALYFLILSYIASHSLSSSFSQTSETSELSSLYTEVLLDDGGIDRKVSEYMQTLLRERFTNKMLEIVDELQLAYSHHDLVRGAGSVFPVRAGEFHFWFVYRDIALLPLSITVHSNPLLRTCCFHCI